MFISTLDKDEKSGINIYICIESIFAKIFLFIIFIDSRLRMGSEINRTPPLLLCAIDGGEFSSHTTT